MLARPKRHGCTLRSLFLLCLVTAPSACAPLDAVPTASSNPRPIAVPVTYTHDVYFAADSTEISADEAKRLRTFLDALPGDRELSVRIIGMTDDRTGDARHAALSLRRARGVAELAEARRFAAIEIAEPSGNRAAMAGAGERRRARSDRVEIRVSGYEVRLPACPDWSRRPEGDGRNLPLSNLGCANAVNLGLMVSNPADLDHGRALAPADGSREAEAIVRYRTDKAKQLDTEMLRP
ncbi:CpaD family pilus assembly lipoprotein [Benzoatithermus flavus]|uniref:CpaD family pilus assembly lipoprotein n=1 Tax=Benzoatithermus flavus TaxID=3108223 RepID=A0ABU8XZ08_9PROT